MEKLIDSDDIGSSNSSYFNEVELIPPASSLIESMRDIGYTLNTAVADILDNSIAANSSKIDIYYINDTEPLLMIVDDGHGMTKEELLSALRFAYVSPNDDRAINDLGRFGLGLKTASFSQARKLTVVTHKNNQITCAIWDLDHIVKTKKWLLQVVDLKDISISGEILENIKPHGTIVLWENIDRFGDNKDNQNINSYISELRDHIALVFHRYLDIKQTNHIKIRWCLNSKFSIFISLLNIILVDKNMNSRNVHCLLLRETQALTNKPTHSSPDSRITTLYMACFTPILATFMQTWIKGFIIGFPHIAFGDEVLITWRNVCAKLLTGFDASITNIITDYLFCSTT